jgi:hypothetical protein
MLAQGAEFATGEGVGGGRTILNPPNMQDRAREVDLLPPEVNDLPSAQPVPERKEDHERVPLPPTIALRGLDQLLHLRQGKVFSRSQCGVGQAQRDCSNFSGWRNRQVDRFHWTSFTDLVETVGLLAVL